MEEALRQTLYCDHGHPDIQALAATLRAGRDDPEAIARRTFHFVRDEIRFGFDLYQRRASETLKCGYGACWNKALLLTTLLRGNRIPAQFGSIPLRRTFVRPAIGLWHSFLNDPFNHGLVQAYLNERWTILDPTLDQRTFAALFRTLGVEWGIDWEGAGDVNLYTESVAGQPVIHADIDGALNGKLGNIEWPKPLAVLINWHLQRQMWKRIDAHVSAEAAAANPGSFRA